MSVVPTPSPIPPVKFGRPRTSGLHLRSPLRLHFLDSSSCGLRKIFPIRAQKFWFFLFVQLAVNHATRAQSSWLLYIRVFVLSRVSTVLTPFYVYTSHQKVVLEVDFSGSLWVRCTIGHSGRRSYNNILEQGYTEITLIPTNPNLRTIHLHSRQCSMCCA